MVLGLVTTKRGRLENTEELTQRIFTASRYISRERLGISPQCGFASSIIGNNISFDGERLKLKLVVEAAQRIWG